MERIPQPEARVVSLVIAAELHVEEILSVQLRVRDDVIAVNQRQFVALDVTPVREVQRHFVVVTLGLTTADVHVGEAEHEGVARRCGHVHPAGHDHWVGLTAVQPWGLDVTLRGRRFSSPLMNFPPEHLKKKIPRFQESQTRGMISKNWFNSWVLGSVSRPGFWM